MIDILTTVVPFVVAAIWIIRQQRSLTTTLKRLEKAEQRLHSAKLTLTTTKETNEGLAGEVLFLKSVLYDVATGDAYVWIEDDELRATRKATGETPIH